MKTFLEIVEKTITVFLLAFASLGLFLVGVMAGNLFYGSVSWDGMWRIFLVSAALTFGAWKLWGIVRFRRLSILAEELENSSEEADELYEHLKVRGL